MKSWQVSILSSSVLLAPHLSEPGVLVFVIALNTITIGAIEWIEQRAKSPTGHHAAD